MGFCRNSFRCLERCRKCLPEFLHNAYGQRMHIPRRLRAGALHLDHIARRRAQNPLRQVAPAGIAGAQNENRRFHAAHRAERQQLLIPLFPTDGASSAWGIQLHFGPKPSAGAGQPETPARFGRSPASSAVAGPAPDPASRQRVDHPLLVAPSLNHAGSAQIGQMLGPATCGSCRISWK